MRSLLVCCVVTLAGCELSGPSSGGLLGYTWNAEASCGDRDIEIRVGESVDIGGWSCMPDRRHWTPDGEELLVRCERQGAAVAIGALCLPSGTETHGARLELTGENGESCEIVLSCNATGAF